MVKLDTNGTNPTMAKRLINKCLVDYLAVDVKAPLTEEKYSKASGINAKTLLQKIEETIDTLLELNISHEFRTTVVPTIHRKEDIEEKCHRIRGCQKYAIQNYKTQVDTIDPKFKGLKPFPQRRMMTFLGTAKKIIPDTILRG